MSAFCSFLKRSLTAPLLAVCCLCALAAPARAQIISTVAGNGNNTAYDSNSNGGQATTAQLGYPLDVVLDNAGNFYFSEYTNQVVRKVSPAGIISIVAGNGGTGGYSGDGGLATSAQIKGPRGLRLDSAGNLYFAERENNVVRKVSATTGFISTVAGVGPGLGRGYNGDGIAATTAKLSYPQSVLQDSTGNIYIADSFNNRIRMVNTAGIISTVAGTGAQGYTGDGFAATSALLNHPYHMVLDSAGNLYFSDSLNNVIRKVNTATGIISTVVGNVGNNSGSGYSGDNGPATAALLNAPYGVALDSAGNLYFADSGNNVIRKVSAATGLISTVVGTGTGGYNGDGGQATAAQLSSPSGVALDNAGNLYIADYSNFRIRKVAGLAPPAAVNVPSLSPAGLAMLVLLLGGVAIWQRRRA